MGLAFGLGSIITGCSDNDDYQVAEPLQAGNQQVHFSSVNKAKTILGSDAQTKEVDLTVVRTTTSGTTTVPVALTDATPGVTADQQVTLPTATRRQPSTSPCPTPPRPVTITPIRSRSREKTLTLTQYSPVGCPSPVPPS